MTPEENRKTSQTFLDKLYLELDSLVDDQRAKATYAEFSQRVLWSELLQYNEAKLMSRLFAYCIWRYVRKHGSGTAVFKGVRDVNGGKLPIWMIEAVLDHEAGIRWDSSADLSFLREIPEGVMGEPGRVPDFRS